MNNTNSPQQPPDRGKTGRMSHAQGGELSRKPPVAVRRELRREVGFGCPASGCGNPYLQYHHFDPPWEIEHHHDPARMIALCSNHHAKAEAWTVDQCRAMKSVSGDRPEVRGKFEWMRDDILAVIGGHLCYETPNMVVFRDTPIVWFNRDEQRHLLLNFRLLTTSKGHACALRITTESFQAILSMSKAHLRGTGCGCIMRMVTICPFAFANGQTHTS